MNPIILRFILTGLGGAVAAIGQLPDLKGSVLATILTLLGGALGGGALFRRPGDVSQGDA